MMNSEDSDQIADFTLMFLLLMDGQIQQQTCYLNLKYVKFIWLTDFKSYHIPSGRQ